MKLALGMFRGALQSGTPLYVGVWCVFILCEKPCGVRVRVCVYAHLHTLHSVCVLYVGYSMYWYKILCCVHALFACICVSPRPHRATEVIITVPGKVFGYVVYGALTPLLPSQCFCVLKLSTWHFFFFFLSYYEHFKNYLCRCCGRDRGIYGMSRMLLECYVNVCLLYTSPSPRD